MDANNIFRNQPTPAEEKKEIAADGKDEVGKYFFLGIFIVSGLVLASELSSIPVCFILTCYLVDETNGEYLKPNWD